MGHKRYVKIDQKLLKCDVRNMWKEYDRKTNEEVFRIVKEK